METKKVVLQIEGMSCLSCAATIEKSLSKVGRVSNPAVNFTKCIYSWMSVDNSFRMR